MTNEEYPEKEYYIYNEDETVKIAVIDYVTGIIVAIPIKLTQNKSYEDIEKIKAATRVNQILSGILDDLKEGKGE